MRGVVQRSFSRPWLPGEPATPLLSARLVRSPGNTLSQGGRGVNIVRAVLELLPPSETRPPGNSVQTCIPPSYKKSNPGAEKKNTHTHCSPSLPLMATVINPGGSPAHLFAFPCCLSRIALKDEMTRDSKC